MHSFLKKINWIHILAAFALSIVLYMCYLHLYISVFQLPLPKTQYLKSRNNALQMEVQMLGRRMHAYQDALEDLQIRDEEIYRSIFGLAGIPASVRDQGIAGDERFSDAIFHDRKGYLADLCKTSDLVMKKAAVQSKSYDEIALMLQSADQMATSIPAICPIVPDRNKFHISSVFGYRVHPVLGYRKMHQGVDFSIAVGNPVYATGDGVVETVKIERRGYGRQVVVDHGFGYKTRYAHCKTILVAEGMKVKRGEQIATTGNSGISTAPHLHYEVIYKGKCVNPFHYYDLDIPVKQYMDIISTTSAQSEKMYVHPMHQKKQ